jgi:hypothetical protein
MPAARKRHSPWIAAIIIGFVLMIAANAVFIYVAVSGADPVASSYRTEPR